MFVPLCLDLVDNTITDAVERVGREEGVSLADQLHELVVDISQGGVVGLHDVGGDLVWLKEFNEGLQLVPEGGRGEDTPTFVITSSPSVEEEEAGAVGEEAEEERAVRELDKGEEKGMMRMSDVATAQYSVPISTSSVPHLSH